MLTITTKVTACNNCPFLRMEQTIYCGHLSLLSEGDAHIIHRDKLETLPEKCPLKTTPVTQITMLKTEPAS